MAIINDLNDNVGRTLFGDPNGVPESDTINGFGGDDTLVPRFNPPGHITIDTVDGGEGFDTLSVAASDQTTGISFFGNGAVGSMFVASAANNISISASNIESLNIASGSGNDAFYTKSFRFGTINAGEGVDFWEHDFTYTSANISFSTKTIVTGGTPGFFISGMDRIFLTTGAGNDTITGGDYHDTIVTNGGNDTIDAGKRPAGYSAYDLIDGGAGTDTWIANASSETRPVFFNAKSDLGSWSLTAESDNFYVTTLNMERVHLTGGRGADTFDVSGADQASINGGPGSAVDYLIADVSDVRSNVHFETVFFARLPGFSSIASIERINLKTGRGNDWVEGYKHADTIATGAGNDRIDAQTHPIGGEKDVVSGGSGLDTLVLWAKGALSRTDIIASLRAINSSDGLYGVIASGMEIAEFHGGSGDDRLTGGSRADELDGWKGNDILNGGAGNDKRMYGWEGNDILIGGTGKENLYGGSGKNTFDFNTLKDSVVGSNRDQIRDFTRGADKIDVSTIDADSGARGNQAFTFIGGKKFSKTDGELRFSGHVLAGDVNGDGRADFEIYVNVTSLRAADLVL